MQMVAEILQHLVQRPEDYLENIEHVIKLYKETILHALEVRTRYIVFCHWLNSFHIYLPIYMICLILLLLSLVECF